ncbi:hypothetical protein DY000_02031528 [Brassica cretica]|uniref:Uncharacterized protein n=1 Tax=Brassica cretica TaxID=69181 RepID=A0ABQ7DC97_BRACR|nr:hypothetical protein DY000_02031528 [Brassica cretica]
MKPASRDDETDVLLKNDETDISFVMITFHTMETIKPLRISRKECPPEKQLEVILPQPVWGARALPNEKWYHPEMKRCYQPKKNIDFIYREPKFRNPFNSIKPTRERPKTTSD